MKAPALPTRRTFVIGARAALYMWLSVIALGLVIKVTNYQVHSNYDISSLKQDPLSQIFLLLTIVAPVMEEFIFRVCLLDMLYSILTEHFYFKRAPTFIAVASLNVILFAVAHETQDPLVLIQRVVGASFLVWAYSEEGYFGSVIAHSLFNFAGFLAFLK